MSAGDGVVDAATTELRVEFSAPMGSYTGVGYGPGGKAAWPITFRVDLAPGRAYGFVLEGSADGGFRSLDGYPLRPDTVQFRTKA